jgi:TatD DNase family protein
MIDLVDTHCHIQSIRAKKGESHTIELWAKAGVDDADLVIKRAKDEGVNTLICVGCDLDDSEEAIDFVADRDNCYASIGIHPHEAKKYVNSPEKLEQFENLVKKPKVIAIGECGLDYFYDHSPKEDQVKILKFQIELAIKYNLPLIFHVREAYDDFWPIIESYPETRAVLHSFTDSKANMTRAVQKGYCIGVNGIATFTKSELQTDMYKSIPIENLVLETDSPYLTPTPFRGNINEPSKVSRVAEYLSEIRSTSLVELSDSTTKNAKRLFRI